MTSSTAPSKSAPAGGFLVTAGTHLRRAAGGGALKRWVIRLLAVVVALVVLWELFLVVVRIATNDMWFDSVHAGTVYTTRLHAQILLFCVFGGIAALVCGLTLWALRHLREPLEVTQEDQTFRWVFRRFEPRVGRLLVLLAAVIPGVLVGKRAVGAWQAYLMWRHVTPTHTTDPVFHKDAAFFLDVYPFHQVVLSLLLQGIKYALVIAIVGGYWYGGWRLRGGRKKITSELTRLVSLLLGGYLVVKALAYWESRYALTTDRSGAVTGASYTDIHATLPGKYVLVGVMALGAVVLIANAVLAPYVRRFGRLRVLVSTLCVVALLVGVVGSAWPGLVYRFRESPSAASLDLDEIAHNQQATLAAFGLDGSVTTVPYTAPASGAGATLVSQASNAAQVSLIDPNKLTPTFNIQQQLQAYYSFKSTLDIGNYTVDGKSQDVAIGVRELKSGAIPKQTWVNTHLVYTHGYGVVAAPTTKMNSTTGTPDYLNGGMPPSQDIPVTRPQVYFGQSFSSSSYSIVGQPAGSTTQLEFDHPGGGGSSKSAHTTYQGDGGISVGSTLRRLLFAVQLKDPNLLFSSEINSASQLLTVRDPRARVAKVAPWLTLDGDVYPAVVDGQIKWIVDGYTTSSTYPESQLVNLRAASKTTITATGASVSQPSRLVNYMNNSVKAVVDAYTGQVTLYAWNQAQNPDPVLQTWEKVFPGLVQPQSSIPTALQSQLRYPTDLFNVQRTLLAKYHVSEPSNFYSGNDFWTVPSDPTTVSNAALPSKYMSMDVAGSGTQRYTLSSPMVTLNGQQIAAFVSVNSEPGPDYGKFTVLEFASGSGSESPAQVQNDIESNTKITNALTLERGGNSKVVLGNLEAVPVAGRMLYVEPVYTQANSGSSFPILRHVIALYGNGDPSFDNDLQTAIKDAVQSAVAKTT